MEDILSYMIANPEPNGSYILDHEIADEVMGLLVAEFSTPTSEFSPVNFFTLDIKMMIIIN